MEEEEEAAVAAGLNDDSIGAVFAWEEEALGSPCRGRREAGSGRCAMSSTGAMILGTMDDGAGDDGEEEEEVVVVVVAAESGDGVGFVRAPADCSRCCELEEG